MHRCFSKCPTKKNYNAMYSTGVLFCDWATNALIGDMTPVKKVLATVAV